MEIKDDTCYKIHAPAIQVSHSLLCMIMIISVCWCQFWEQLSSSSFLSMCFAVRQITFKVWKPQKEALETEPLSFAI